MIRATGLLTAAVCLLAVAPAHADPVPVDQAVAELNNLCNASRAAFEQGGTVRLQLKKTGRVVQEQRYDPVSGRVLDTGWPTLVQRGKGTFDRSGFVLDARLRKAQVKQAAGYLGFRKRPWVLSRGQYGVIASRAFDKYLRTDLLAPDRFVDLDSTLVPSQPQRCASHLLPTGAQATVDRTVVGDVETWSLVLPDRGPGTAREGQVGARGLPGADHLRVGQCCRSPPGWCGCEQLRTVVLRATADRTSRAHIGGQSGRVGPGHRRRRPCDGYPVPGGQPGGQAFVGRASQAGAWSGQGREPGSRDCHPGVRYRRWRAAVGTQSVHETAGGFRSRS